MAKLLRLSRGFHHLVCLSVTRILARVILAVMLRGEAIAGPLEDARTAYKRGDFATALKIWRPRATQGVAFAQVNVGIMYYSGQGVPQDYGEAAKWYRLAAEQGNAIAQGNLGFMYYSGQGVPQDYGEAAKWYRLAAEQGNPTAQSNLGSMYYSGQGVPQDYVQAHMWVDLAASRFPPSAVEDRDQAAHNRDIVASRMTPGQIAEAQRLAREWKPN
jgi:TPR repeat protein